MLTENELIRLLERKHELYLERRKLNSSDYILSKEEAKRRKAIHDDSVSSILKIAKEYKGHEFFSKGTITYKGNDFVNILLAQKFKLKDNNAKSTITIQIHMENNFSLASFQLDDYINFKLKIKQVNLDPFKNDPYKSKVDLFGDIIFMEKSKKTFWELFG